MDVLHSLWAACGCLSYLGDEMMDIRKKLMDIAERFVSAEPRIERQELWCHDCEKYVQFDLDLSLSGNHVLECPNCGHEHCRVVRDGVITDIRWASRNGPTIGVNNQSAISSIYSIYQTTNTQSTFTMQLWGNQASNSWIS